MGILSKVVSKRVSKESSDIAASKLGKLFSDPENTQVKSTNSRKVTKEGLTNMGYESPSFNKADVVKDQRRDLDILAGKGRPETKTKLGENARKAAEDRALSRIDVREKSVVGATAAGYGTGSAIKAGYDASKDKEDRVELSKEAKQRIRSGDLEKGNDERVNKKDYPTYEKETKSAEAFRKEFKDAKEEDKKSFKFEGREYNTESKLAKGGMVVNKGIGASMKPHNVFGKKK